MAGSADYGGPFGRLLELTDIVDRFAGALHREHIAGVPASSPHLSEGLERTWDARTAEWDRLTRSGTDSREVYRRVAEHRRVTAETAEVSQPEPEAEAEP